MVRRLADHFGFHAIRIMTPSGRFQDWGADWMILTRDREWLETAPFTHVATRPLVPVENQRLWTDDYSSLFELMRD